MVSLKDTLDQNSSNSRYTAEAFQRSSDAEMGSLPVEHSSTDRLGCEACFRRCAGCKEAECRRGAEGRSAAEADHFSSPDSQEPVHLLAADLRVGRGIVAPSRSFPLVVPWVDH